MNSKVMILITVPSTIILSTILVLSILFLFPSQIEAIEETLESQQLHPCQKLMLEGIDMYDNPWYEIIKNPPRTPQEADAWGQAQIKKHSSMTESQKEEEYNKYQEKREYIKQQMLHHDCMDINTMQIKGEWLNDQEFQQKVRQKIFDLTGSYPNW